MVWSLDGRRHQRSLGRLPPEEIEGALLKAWAVIDPSSILEDPSGIRTVLDLSRAWYAFAERRPPETRLAQGTLDIYRRAQDAAQAGSAAGMADRAAHRGAGGAAVAPLDDLIPQGGKLDTRGFQRAVQGWMAEEVRRVARSRGVSQGDLVDVTAKTLRLWLKGG